MMRCSACSATQAKWSGSCGTCGEWNTLVEEAEPAKRRAASRRAAAAAPVARLGDTAVSGALHATGLLELDRALGGGMRDGSVVLLSGPPGIGKSTLLLQVAARAAADGRRVLYASGEETAEQIASRAQRLGLTGEIGIVSETDLSSILALLDQDQPDLLIIDSIQTLSSPDIAGSPGSVTQVREASEALRTTCKQRGVTLLLVGQVTKEGSIAGPKTLEHMVDVVLGVEGDARSGLRVVSCTKNRYGPTRHVGVLELTERGMVDVADPATIFLQEHGTPVAGVAVGGALDGQRLFLAEIQALVVPSRLAAPRRVISGFDQRRVELLIAVLDRSAGLQIAGCDVFLTQVGGVALRDPGLDLAAALALASAARGVPLPPQLALAGEVSLTGEVRPATQAAHRAELLAQVGFSASIVPRDRQRPTLREVVQRCLGSAA